MSVTLHNQCDYMFIILNELRSNMEHKLLCVLCPHRVWVNVAQLQLFVSLSSLLRGVAVVLYSWYLPLKFESLC